MTVDGENVAIGESKEELETILGSKRVCSVLITAVHRLKT